MRTAPALLAAIISVVVCSAPAWPAEPRVAIQGYDPVAYFTEGRPVKGSPAIHQDFDGQRYHFMNARHKAMFMNDPDRYIPQFGANCAGLIAFGKLKPASPLHWVIVEDRLYLFSNEKGLAFLAKNPGALAKARQHWASMKK